MSTETSPKAGGELAEEQFKLWFFRECNNGTRRHLYAIFGLPVEEITSHGTERHALRHILASLRASDQPDRNAVLEANIETMREQVARCERWGKSHCELDVAIEETLAALKEPT